MNLLVFAASLRQQSLNRRLAVLAAEIARAERAEVDLAEFRAFDVPSYDGDVNDLEGLPRGAVELKERLEQSDAVLMAVPEYNYSIPGTLKNVIDWVSRARPMPWRGKSVYLMSASPSPMGGIRGLWQTRIPLEGCGALVFPDMFALANAHEAFDEQGKLRDRLMAERLTREIRGFVRLAEAVAPVCQHAETAAARKRQRQITAALEDETQIQSRGGAESRGR